MKYLLFIAFITFYTALGAVMNTCYTEPVATETHYTMCNPEISLPYLETKNGSIADIGKGY